MTTTDPTTATLADQLTPLAAEYADLAERADAIKARQEEIKAAIRDLVPGPDSYDAGSLTVTVSTNRRFDPKVAERILPAELFDAIKIAKPDSAAAREVLPPRLYDQCMSAVGADRITIR